jgi:hypothetical protein
MHPVGISSAIRRHKAGMQDSGCILAVNKNEAAPIFKIADAGICGSLFKVPPLLAETVHIPGPRSILAQWVDTVFSVSTHCVSRLGHSPSKEFPEPHCVF